MTGSAVEYQIAPSFLDGWKRVFLGKPMITEDLQHEKLSNPVALGRSFAGCDLLDRIRPRADHGRVAARCGDGRVCVVAPADRRDPADFVAGHRVVSAGCDGLHPGRGLLHRGQGELRPPHRPGRRGSAVDRLCGHRGDPVRGGHRGRGLGDTGARPLQPGNLSRCGAHLLLREPARIAGGGPDVRGADLLVYRHAHADDRGRHSS